MKVIPRKFYFRDTLTIAENLLGCFLVREYRGKIWRAMITETEAYVGEDDLACHAARGRTPRTDVMYGQPGNAYIYMIYGMYHCLNIVTEKKNFPAAVLIRAARIERIDYKKTNGPGKICKFLKIDRKLNRWDLTKGKQLWLESRDPKPRLPKVHKSRRVGIDYAKHCREYLWRFSLKL
jgi:DNA-3-methyladenine glycosylase